MNTVLDKDFGRLYFDNVWTGLCEVALFGRSLEVELVVQTFDGDPISESQRYAYREFELSKISIGLQVEQAVFNYYTDRVEEFRTCFDADEVDFKAPKVRTVRDMENLVTLRRVKVMSAFEPDARQIGFIFDALFDSQLGVGVLVTNGVVEVVDVQDFLLG